MPLFKMLQQCIEQQSKRKRNRNIKSVQIQFSLLSPDFTKQNNVKRICEVNNIDFLAYSPLAFGILCIDPEKDEDKQNYFLRSLIFKNYKCKNT